MGVKLKKISFLPKYSYKRPNGQIPLEQGMVQAVFFGLYINLTAYTSKKQRQ